MTNLVLNTLSDFRDEVDDRFIQLEKEIKELRETHNKNEKDIEELEDQLNNLSNFVSNISERVNLLGDDLEKITLSDVLKNGDKKINKETTSELDEIIDNRILYSKDLLNDLLNKKLEDLIEAKFQVLEKSLNQRIYDLMKPKMI